MRGWLIFLAFAFPVVLASPSFWALVAMEFSASPVTYIEHDGSFRQALHGPKAPWPEWAVRPDGSKLKVKSWFGPTMKKSSTGFGDMSLVGEPLEVAAKFAETLRADGWEIETSLMRAPLPQFLPRMLEACKVMAKKGEREIHASINLAPNPGTGSLYWSDGSPPPAWRHKSYMDSGTC